MEMTAKAGMGLLLAAAVPIGGDPTLWAQWGLAGQARMIHEGPAARPDLQAIAGVLGPRILDVPSGTPAVLVPAGARPGL